MYIEKTLEALHNVIEEPSILFIYFFFLYDWKPSLLPAYKVLRFETA